MVGSIAAMTSAVCARGISFLGALRTVRAHGEYNYRSAINIKQPEPDSRLQSASPTTRESYGLRIESYTIRSYMDSNPNTNP